MTFWKAKRVRKPVPLRAPWLLCPNWTRDLRRLLTFHVNQTRHYNTTLQTPSTAIVFTKFPSVMDSLCNHKEAATKWADGETPKCACDALRPHAPRGLQPDHHLVLDGDNLHFDDGPHTSIATGSLQNKIFPPSKEIQTSLCLALRTWTTRNSLPSLQKSHIDELWHRSIQSHYHTSTITSLTKTSAASNVFSQTPSSTTRTSELHPYESTVPYSTSSASPPPSPIRWYFANWSKARVTSSSGPSPRSTAILAKRTHGHLVLDETCRMPMFYPNGRNSSRPDDPLSASSRRLSDLC